MIELFKKEGFGVKEEKEVKDDDIKMSSLLILSSKSSILRRIFGKIEQPSSGFAFMVRKNPLNPSKVIALAHGNSEKEINAAAKKIFHYGRYSMVTFKEGENIEKKRLKKVKGG